MPELLLGKSKLCRQQRSVYRNVFADNVESTARHHSCTGLVQRLARNRLRPADYHLVRMTPFVTFLILLPLID